MAKIPSITKKQWESLPSESKELIRNLGILVDGMKAPKIRPPKKPTLSPYVLGVVTKCKTCNSVTVDSYLMHFKENSDCIHSVRLESSSEIPNKWRTESTTFCKNCEYYLRFQRKDDLIAMIMKLLRRIDI